MNIDILSFEIYFITKYVSCVLRSRYFLNPDLLVITISTAVTRRNIKAKACGNEF